MSRLLPIVRHAHSSGIPPVLLAVSAAVLLFSIRPAAAQNAASQGTQANSDGSGTGTSVESAFANYVQQWISDAENPAVLRRLTAQARNNAIYPNGITLKPER
jgi:hypothetical protein